MHHKQSSAVGFLDFPVQQEAREQIMHHYIPANASNLPSKPMHGARIKMSRLTVGEVAKKLIVRSAVTCGDPDRSEGSC